MAGYLEPVVAELKGDISDFLAKMEAAKAAMRDLNDTAAGAAPFGSGNESVIGETISSDFKAQLDDALGDLGQEIDKKIPEVEEESGKLGGFGGRSAGKSWVDEFQRLMNETDRLSLNTDVMLERSRRLGEDMGARFGEDFTAIVGHDIVDGIDHGAENAENEASGSFVELGYVKGAAIVAGITAGLAALPAAIIYAGTLGFAGLGAYMDYEFNPKFKKSVDNIVQETEKALGKASGVLTPYLDKILDEFSKNLGKVESGLEKGFKAVGPLLQPIASGIAGLVDKPFKGFVAMLAAPSTAKVIDDVSQGLANIGDSIGDMFQSFTGKNAESSGEFLEQILDLAGGIIRVIGKMSGDIARGIMAIEPYLKPLITTFDLLFQIIKQMSPALEILAKASLLVLAGALDFVNEALKGFLALVKLVHPYLEDANKWVSSFTKEALKDVANWANETPQFFEHVWHDISNWAVDVYNAVISAWHHVYTDTTHWWNDVVGALEKFWRTIRNSVTGAFKGAGSWLYNTGRDIIGGLINGITAMIGSVGSAMSKVGQEIWDHLPHSPAKKGPLSGDGSPVNSGRTISKQLAQGIVSGQGFVSEAMSGVLGSGISSGVAAHGRLGMVGGAGGNVNVTMNISGSVLSEKDLRNIIQTQFLQLGARRSNTYTPFKRSVTA